MSVTTEHIARKPRRCGERPCQRTIEEGHRYRRLVLFPGDGGHEDGFRPWVIVQCWHCVYFRGESTLAWVRGRYNVPARLDARVSVGGREGVIWGGSGGHVLVRLDGDKHPQPYHPTDLQYLTVESRS